MSKSSPIYILDSDESDVDDERDRSRRESIRISTAKDNDTRPVSSLSPQFAQISVTIKEEEDSPPLVNGKLNVYSGSKINLNTDRLKWLSGKIKLPSVSPVKTEITSDHNDRHMPAGSYGDYDDRHMPAGSHDDNDDRHMPAGSHGDNERHTPAESTSYDNNDCDYMLMQRNANDDDVKYIPSIAIHDGYSEEKSDKDCRVGLFEAVEKKYLPQSQVPLKTEPENRTSQFLPPSNKKSDLKKVLKKDSPRRVGVFGSPDKLLKQTTLNQESFSPKKQSSGPAEKLEDSSYHMPPLHAVQVIGYESVKHIAFPFTESQINLIEAVREEGLLQKYIDAVMSLVTTRRNPTPDICLVLMKQTLLKAKSVFMASKAFCALKRIHTLHPYVPEQIGRKLEWEFIENIVERMEILGCTSKCPEDTQDKCQDTPRCLKTFSATKTLTFLLSVMESEVIRKPMSLKRTHAFRLLSLQKSSRNVVQTLNWLRTCIVMWCSSGHDQYFTALGLFQRMIQLSLSVSEDSDDCADQLAGELLSTYSNLPNLESRSVFLQSLHSNLLRSKFLKLFIEVFYEEPEVCAHVQSTGIQRIVMVDFERLPIKQDGSGRMCLGYHRTEQECEEHAMIISYLLQSYLFCHHKKLQSKRRMTLALKEDEVTKRPNNRRHLSISDVNELCKMGDKVVIFTGRLFSLCPTLTQRTHELLELLSNNRLWDTW